MKVPSYHLQISHKKIPHTELEGVKDLQARHPTNGQECAVIGYCPGKGILGVVLPNVSDVRDNVRGKHIN